MARGARARACHPRAREPARGRHRRWRAGRHRARRAIAPARRADDHPREERAGGRQLAQPLQVALPARSGLVRPLPLPPVPGQLAGVLAEGQARRLDGDVHPRHGAQLLDEELGEERLLRRAERHLDDRGRSRRREPHPLAEAARARHRHVGQAQPAGLPRHGHVRGRSAPLLAAPGTRRLPGQAGGRRRLEQLGTRHLRRALGERCRRDDGAAVLHAHRALGLADGDRARRAVLRAGRRERRDDGEGRHDLRLAAVPHPARVPDPAVRADEGARRGLLRRARAGRPSSSTGAPTARDCS